MSYPEALFKDFQKRADDVKNQFLQFLLYAKQRGQTIGAFGAAAKGNTFLNYAGIRADLIPYIVDDTPQKWGKVCPGSRIPVYPNFPDDPDLIVVFPWNFKQEIKRRLKGMGGSLVYAIPSLEIQANHELAAA